MLSELRVGPVVSVDGTINPGRAGRAGEFVVQDLHARLYEAAFRSALFCYGLSSTALVAANAVATGVTSSAQPIIGLWNPVTSPVNLVVQKVIALCTVVANTAVAPGGLVYLVSTNQSAISSGSNPFNLKTLAQSGSYAKAFAFSTALTGLSGSLVVMRAANIGAINAAGPGTAITQPVGSSEELIDGGIIIPPGGVLALMNQIATTTVSYNSGIVWEEVPI